MGNKYFTDNNLETFLGILNSRYANRNETSLGAGLALTQLFANDSGALEVDANGIEATQGKYYYCEDPVLEVKLNGYKYIDTKIMGEVAIQFKTAETRRDENGDDVRVESVPVLGGDDWYWCTASGSKPVFKGNSMYQIKLTSDQNGSIFAEVNSYETINIEAIDPETYSYIKITYNPSDTEFESANYTWLNGMNDTLIPSILFAADGNNYEEISINDLKKNRKLKKSADKKPVLIFKFNDSDMITFENLLENVNFDEFEININASRIISMHKMFYSSTNTHTFTKINLSGISESERFFENTTSCKNNMFEYMFAGRKMNIKDDSGEKFILFGIDDYGKYTGIETKNALSLEGMFYNGPLTDAHCAYSNKTTSDINNYKSGPNNIFKRLSFNKCTNFVGMFYGCKFNDLYFDNIIDNLDWNARLDNDMSAIVLDFSYMFADCPNIKGAQLKKIYHLIENLTNYSFESNNTKNVITYCFNGMFEHCNNLDDLSKFELTRIFSKEQSLSNIYMRDMFAGCPRAYNVPVIQIKTSDVPKLRMVDMTRMFGLSFSSNSKFELVNTKSWILQILTKDIVIIMDEMFMGCPLSNINSGTLEFFNYNDDSYSNIEMIDRENFIAGGYIYESRLRMARMFYNTCPTSSESINITWNMQTGSITGLDPNKLPYTYIEDILDTDNTKGYITIASSKSDDPLDVDKNNGSVLYNMLRNKYANTVIYNNINPGGIF